MIRLRKSGGPALPRYQVTVLPSCSRHIHIRVTIRDVDDVSLLPCSKKNLQAFTTRRRYVPAFDAFKFVRGNEQRVKIVAPNCRPFNSAALLKQVKAGRADDRDASGNRRRIFRFPPALLLRDRNEAESVVVERSRKMTKNADVSSRRE